MLGLWNTLAEALAKLLRNLAVACLTALVLVPHPSKWTLTRRKIVFMFITLLRWDKELLMHRFSNDTRSPRDLFEENMKEF